MPILGFKRVLGTGSIVRIKGEVVEKTPTSYLLKTGNLHYRVQYGPGKWVPYFMG
jgi:hypothetical protein